MSEKTLNFKEFPSSMKNGILFLIIGWVWHYFFLYRFSKFPSVDIQPKMVLSHLVLGLGICYCVIKVKKWARPLCITGNSIIIIYHLFFMSLFVLGNKMNLSVLSGIIVIFFSISTYYLAIKKTSKFFKEYNKKDGEDENKKPSTNKA
ncbi:hypothetical protein QUF80_16640 [Desulfococcaceae bacterium HSG8]|nr:hypothetical protein [Desulfococcaceae bacterium HSG8]